MAQPPGPETKPIAIGTSWTELISVEPPGRVHVSFFVRDEAGNSADGDLKTQYSPDETIWYDTINSKSASIAYTHATSVMLTNADLDSGMPVIAPFMRVLAKKDSGGEKMIASVYYHDNR